jgi:hypothetical protein
MRGRGEVKLFGDGYCAARLAVLEHLAGQGRQAGMLAVRVDR